ncbi:MAG: hypothetical protein M3290_13465, partial [Actinomycetota bacterium]|nr:hypothetical protein [Actinomycetota bacterium]
DPEMRYPDGAALADALTGSVAGTVAAPIPPPPPDETAAIAVTSQPAIDDRPSRAPWIAAASLLLAGIIGIALWLTSGDNSNAHVPAVTKLSPSATP